MLGFGGAGVQLMAIRLRTGSAVKRTPSRDLLPGSIVLTWILSYSTAVSTWQ